MGKRSAEVQLLEEQENHTMLKLEPEPEPSKQKRRTKPKKNSKPEQEPLSLPLPDDLNELLRIVDSKIRSIKYNTASSCRKIHTSCEIIADLEFDQNEDDPYVLKKVLEKSDVKKGLDRLMLNKKMIKDFMSCCWGSEQVAAVLSDAGLRVNIYDRDLDSTHRLTLKRWPSNDCYVFQNKWMESFVERRSLVAGDTVRLYWDSFESHFCFSVLNKKNM